MIYYLCRLNTEKRIDVIIDNGTFLIVKCLDARKDEVGHNGIVSKMKVVEDKVIEFDSEAHYKFSRSFGGRKLVQDLISLEIIKETDDLSDSFVFARI